MMIIEAKTHFGFTVIDAATGAKLTNVVSVDDAKREMVLLKLDAAGKPYVENGRIAQMTEPLRAVRVDLRTKVVTVYRVWKTKSIGD